MGMELSNSATKSGYNITENQVEEIFNEIDQDRKVGFEEFKLFVFQFV